MIFLDIDGVLNSKAHPVRSTRHVGWEWTPSAVSALRELLCLTPARLVISSSHKRHRSLRDMRVLFGCYALTPYVVGLTPDLVGQDREVEITAYVARHPGVPWVILDDMKLSGPCGVRQVHVDHRVGLTHADVQAALAILGG